MRHPPRKRAGQGAGPRRVQGALLDVASAAAWLGETEKQLRAQLARGLIPHRRLGGRLVLLADELTEFLRRLPGVSPEEALRNIATRRARGEDLT